MKSSTNSEKHLRLEQSQNAIEFSSHNSFYRLLSSIGNNNLLRKEEIMNGQQKDRLLIIILLASGAITMSLAIYLILRVG